LTAIQPSRDEPRHLLLVDTGSGLWGGQRYAVRLIEYLSAAGFEVVIAAQAGSALGEWWHSCGGQTLLLPGRIVQRRGVIANIRNGGLIARHCITLRRYVRSTHTDVLVGNSSASHPAVAIAGATTGVASVLIVHEENHPPLVRDIAIRLSSQAIAVSTRVWESVASYGRPKTKIVHNGVDTTRYQPGERDREIRNFLSSIPDGVIIGCIGRIDPAKQVEDVILSVSSLPEELAEDVSLVCIGSTSHDAKYELQIQSLGASLLNSRYRQFPAREDVERLLQNVDIVIFAGNNEGMSLGMLEAMSSGCAVVAYAAAGVEEVIVNGVSGIVVSMGDKRALVAAIESLVTSPKLRSQMGSAARERIQESFDLKARAGDVVELIQATF
jgi:glycosyltransferase involved in cell wall biosynthesis